MCGQVYCICRHNYGPGMDSHPIRVARLCISYTGSNTHNMAILNKYLACTTTYNDTCAMIKGILQIGLHRGLLRAIPAAKTTSTTALLAVYGIAAYYLAMIAKSATTIYQ